METQLAYDGQDKQLGLRFREKLVTDLGIVCKVRGLLNTVSGGVDWDANLWKAVHPLQKPAATHSRYAAPRPGQPSPLALMLGATYHSGSDEVVPWLRAKQHLRTPGSWRLKLRGTLQYPTKTQEVTALGDVQLSRAVYNLTRAQDARVLAGYRVDWQPNQQPAYEPYCQLRENNWSLNFVPPLVGRKATWSVRYDL